MSAPPAQQGEPITDRRQLVEYIAGGSKPRESWRIGTEHEKLIFDRETLRRAPYEGARASIRALLEGLVKFGFASQTVADHFRSMLRRHEASTSDATGKPRRVAH